jgi:transposase
VPPGLGPVEWIIGRAPPGVHQAIGATSATLLFLPASNPDLYSIEQVFAKLRAMLRKMAPRSVDGLWKALGTIIGCVFPQECKNFARHAGYFQSW